MRKFPILFLYLFLMIFIGASLSVGGGVGCDENGEPTPTATPTATPIPTPTPPVADLVMGDRESNRVFIYPDVFNQILSRLNQTGDQTQKFFTVTDLQPVILDSPNSEICNPRALWVVDNTLFVANRRSCYNGGEQVGESVTIFKNFSNLQSLQEPDVVLEGDLGVTDLEIFNNDLYFTNVFGDEINIFRNISTLAPGDPPTVTLDNTGSGIDRPSGLAVANNILYVCNQYGDGQPGDDDDDDDNGAVSIFLNADQLTDFAEPDIILDSNNSFIDNPIRCFVHDNTLYVVNDDAGQNGAVMAFSPADGLVNGQAPDYSITGTNINSPHHVEMCGDRLFISQKDAPGLVGFDLPIDQDSALDPDVILGPDMFRIGLSIKAQSVTENDYFPPLWDVTEVACLEGTLVGAGGWGLGRIFGYYDSASIVDQQEPDLEIFHPAMQEPQSIILVPRD